MVSGSNAPIAFSSALCRAFSTDFDVELIRSRLLLISGDLKGRDLRGHVSYLQPGSPLTSAASRRVPTKRGRCGLPGGRSRSTCHLADLAPKEASVKQLFDAA